MATMRNMQNKDTAASGLSPLADYFICNPDNQFNMDVVDGINQIDRELSGIDKRIQKACSNSLSKVITSIEKLYDAIGDSIVSRVAAIESNLANIDATIVSSFNGRVNTLESRVPIAEEIGTTLQTEIDGDAVPLPPKVPLPTPTTDWPTTPPIVIPPPIALPKPPPVCNPPYKADKYPLQDWIMGSLAVWSTTWFGQPWQSVYYTDNGTCKRFATYPLCGPFPTMELANLAKVNFTPGAVVSLPSPTFNEVLPFGWWIVCDLKATDCGIIKLPPDLPPVPPPDKPCLPACATTCPAPIVNVYPQIDCDGKEEGASLECSFANDPQYLISKCGIEEIDKWLESLGIDKGLANPANLDSKLLLANYNSMYPSEKGKF